MSRGNISTTTWRRTLYMQSNCSGMLSWKNCLKRYNPVCQIALDEAIIRYKGAKASVKKFFMKGKPIKAGFKIYAVCESATGYMLNFAVHKNVAGQTMKDIAINVFTPFLGKWHTIFCDRLYASMHFAKSLLENQSNICDSIMMKRLHLANDMSSSPRKAGRERASHIKNMMSTQCGTMYFCQKGDLLTHCLWRDSRIFSILYWHQAHRKKPTDYVLSWDVSAWMVSSNQLSMQCLHPDN